MSQKTLGELAKYLDAELVGDAQLLLDSLADIKNAASNQISFVSQDKYKTFLETTSAGAVILNPSLADVYTGNKLIVADPYLAYAKLSRLFESLSCLAQNVHPTAVVSETAIIADTAAVGANSVIGENVTIGEGARLYPGVFVGDNAVIGKHTLLHANVTIYHGVTIGENTIIHSGTVIGSDGFGFAPSEGKWNKIHQLGGVVIGNNVEIGSNTSIDRGAIEDTIINDGVIIDNLVHIAHNVKIGTGTAIAGCVGIAGSTELGKNCIVAGAVAINGHISIADNTQFHGGTIVTKGNDEPGAFASTPPLQNVKQWRRNSVRYMQLDELTNRVKALEKKLKELGSG